MKKYHIGLTQWGFSEWTGNFFTENATPDLFLEQYSSVFNSVEGNTTFYHTPDKETVKNWMQKVPADFKFCFKFPKLITHQKKLRDAADDTLSFLDRFQPYRQNLGPFHIQLGPRFSYKDFSVLDSFLEMLPAHLDFALEVRHPDFFDKGKKEKELNNLLRSLGIDRVVFDTRRLHSMKSRDPLIKRIQNQKPKMPVRFETTGAFPSVRFVGTNTISGNEAYLKEWAIILADWIREGKHPYMFVHAPNTLHAPALAKFFHGELARLIQIPPLPDWPSDRANKQLGLF